MLKIRITALIVRATVYYKKLLSTYIALNCFEETISGGIGQTEMTEHCIEHFKRIYQDIPENLSESFSFLQDHSCVNPAGSLCHFNAERV